MQVDINQLASDLLGWAVAGSIGFVLQWAIKLRKDVNAAHRKIREIVERMSSDHLS
jgi:hypothetical protein